jgi:hypothetical protein
VHESAPGTGGAGVAGITTTRGVGLGVFCCCGGTGVFWGGDGVFCGGDGVFCGGAGVMARGVGFGVCCGGFGVKIGGRTNGDYVHSAQVVSDDDDVCFFKESTYRRRANRT